MTAFIERVSLVNYKSIAACDVALRPLTVVVGRNGSGKSNFVDSLHFIADALNTTLEFAIRKRGGMKALTRQRGGKQPLQIELTFRLATNRIGTYLLKLHDRGVVAEERLHVASGDGATVFAHFERSDSRVMTPSADQPPVVLNDRLALVALSGREEFRSVFDALTAMRFYHLNPDAMRVPEDFDEGSVLREDGTNIASVWSHYNEETHHRLTAYLKVIVPDIEKIHRKTVGDKETLHFHQSGPQYFYASSMSDGTLRALGALVATSQSNGSQPPSLVAIEEPETALHPGAIAAIMDAMHEASIETQIVLTSHSPDMLDQVNIDADALLVTELRDGSTVVAEVDGASREAIRRHLYSPGELLRMDQLQPAESLEPAVR